MRLDSIKVACPRCGAGRDEKCRSGSGKTNMNYTHRARLDAAKARLKVK